MDLNRIKLFTRVVETGSLTKAAAELGVTTSSVSRALARLEADLGVRLLQRTTRRLHLTAVGRAYFDQVHGALSLVHEAGAAAHEMGEEPSGVVRVTVPPSLAGVVLDIVAKFVRQYPRIRIELSVLQRVVDMIDEGFDLALRVGRLRDSSLLVRQVGALRSGLFTSRDYVRRRGQPRQPSDLTEHDCIVFRGHDGKTTWRLHSAKHEETVTVSGPIQVDEIPSAHQAVIAGLGIGQMSLFASAGVRGSGAGGSRAGGSRAGGLVRVLPSYEFAELAVSLVSPSKRLEPARVALLREFLAVQLRRLHWQA